jgi:F-type H+-transporting ATPase subunit delta
MSASAVANRYARALVELAAETGQVSTVTEQLQQVADIYRASNELRVAIENPLVEDSKRIALLSELAQRLGLLPLVKNTLQLLAAKRRCRALPEIAQRAAQLADLQSGIVQARVTSAAPLTDSQVAILKTELERLTGCRVALEHIEDPALLAGMVTRVGDHVIDASLRGQLREIEQRLIEVPA